MVVASKSFWKPVVIAAAAATFVGALGATLTDTGPWYQRLQKPWWQPPDWLFGPAWTLIFALAAMSAIYAWRGTRTTSQREWVIGLFALNGFLNIVWSTLFFAARRPDWALVEVPLLWLSILIAIAAFWRMSRAASYYLLPYLLWVTFAAYLNWTVVQLNAPFDLG
ncbi:MULTISPECIES: TspO/MBR family protein [Rhodopseudomonas]|uniref:TspO n=1 Tax=Rhodopseudomonas palustris TaxID=1076 RepID=A0A0D7EP79_RHOPL|nr:MULTISPECIES: TspO/MBR family protein [Rhodopseudomonas]KIZ41242.1 TspO [Rhodopseudomonas palustris]MDF3813377.1 tryptophan-rich sensory protein [Rhodopseudomonas sp. BAL398]WOK20387.1 TspO/MBR family protein [Rhodopseudomonas sp. BAL398]